MKILEILLVSVAFLLAAPWIVKWIFHYWDWVERQ